MAYRKTLWRIMSSAALTLFWILQGLWLAVLVVLLTGAINESLRLLLWFLVPGYLIAVAAQICGYRRVGWGGALAFLVLSIVCIAVPELIIAAYNLHAFLNHHPLYQDSPATIYVVLIHVLLFGVIPISLAVLALANRVALLNMIKGNVAIRTRSEP